MERKDYTIRAFEQSDRPEVIALIEENGLTKGVYGFLDGIISEAQVIVAENEGEVIGTVVMEDDVNHNNATCVQYLVVDANHRGKNLGKALMIHAEDLMKQQNKSASIVYPLESKPEVISFYRNLGYIHNAPKLKKKL